MNTELEKINNSLESITADEALEGLGTSSTDLLKPVRLDLIQPINSGGGKTAGEFLDSQTQVSFKKINIVPLGFSEGRLYFPPGESGLTRPLCRSINGVVPVIGDDLVPQDSGEGCAKCPKGSWNRIAGKNIRPECKETVSLLFLERLSGFPYRIVAKGNSLTSFRNLKETIRKYVIRTNAEGKLIPPYGYEIEMSSSLVTKGGYKFYVINFGTVNKISDPSMVAEFGKYYKKYIINKAHVDDDSSTVEEADSAISSIVDGEYQDV